MTHTVKTIHFDRKTGRCTCSCGRRWRNLEHEALREAFAEHRRVAGADKARPAGRVVEYDYGVPDWLRRGQQRAAAKSRRVA